MAQSCLAGHIIIIIIIMEKMEAGLRGLCIREIDVKSQILDEYCCAPTEPTGLGWNRIPEDDSWGPADPQSLSDAAP